MEHIEYNVIVNHVYHVNKNFYEKILNIVFIFSPENKRKISA